MRARARAAALVLGTLVLAACGSGDAEPEPSNGPVSALGEQRSADPSQALAGAATTGATSASEGVRCPAVEPAEPVEGGLPELTLECLGPGPAGQLSALRGPLVLNVWASWCGPCAEETPFLLEASAALGSQVRFLGVDLTDQADAAAEWLSFHRVTYPSYADPKGLVRAALKVPGPPATLFVRSDGTLAQTHYGAFTSAQEVSAAVAEHLGVRS